MTFSYIEFFLFPFGSSLLLQNPEPIVWKCPMKYAFLKIFQNSKEKNLCQSVFLIKTWNFIKTETPWQVFFCEFSKIVKNTYLVEHLRTACSENGSTKGNNAVRNLSIFFCIEELVFR